METTNISRRIADIFFLQIYVPFRFIGVRAITLAHAFLSSKFSNLCYNVVFRVMSYHLLHLYSFILIFLTISFVWHRNPSNYFQFVLYFIDVYS